MTTLDRARERDLAEVVAERHIIVCTGSGGVGKTTTAATLAVAAARQGRRTIVVTIDPARRLAQSMGLDALDNTPRAVDAVPNLDAMMLDMKRTFDEVIDRHADDPSRAARIKSNRFYQQISGQLAGTQEYMAMEKLFDLHSTGRYDCIVVDTPPTRNALDFLDAPKRLTDFLDGKFLKMFLSPGLTATKTIGRMAAFGTGLFMKAAGRITGAGVLDDLAEFFQSFEGMYEGFKNRAQLVHELLSSGDAAFVVVSSGEPTALREARYFVQRLAKEGMPLAGLVLNRVTPALPEDLAALAARVGEDDRTRLLAGDDDQRAVAGMLGLLDRSAQVHARQQRNIESGLHGLDPRTLVEVPEMPSDVHDLEGLDAIGAHLVRG
ncbi:ArsA family ATPase [Euzebya rosea]|uniref:ArsA family ATPase n=1 Tax=Euzebya rosea TaxID=2052804 RepID=UPI000D3E205F|nr:ArsA-related P-loop ATPase [Euzebya rosea]